MKEQPEEIQAAYQEIGVEPWEVRMHELADELAEQGAAEILVPMHIKKQLNYRKQVALLTQFMMLQIWQFSGPVTKRLRSPVTSLFLKRPGLPEISTHSRKSLPL